MKKTLSFSNKPEGGKMMENTRKIMYEKYEMNEDLFGVNNI